VRAAANLREDLGLPAGAVLVLFLGRLFPKKGLDLLIPAFARIATEQPGAVLLIAGHDAGTGYRQVVEGLIQRFGVGHNVRLLGELRSPRKFEVLRAADVFVLPSYSEGLPVAVLEAMACARPVVVTPGCNLPDVSAAQAGWTADATVDGVLDGLRAALASKNERLRRGGNGRRLVTEKYTWDRIAHASIQLYQSNRLH
jgi:glycosyltransferase involved in cell wall biosynthesis